MCADRVESLLVCPAGFAAFFEDFTKSAILGLATILQQSLEATRPVCHSSPLSRPLLHPPSRCPVDARKKPPHPLLHLKIDRKSCCGRFHRGNYAFFQLMRIPPPPLDSSASNSASPSFLPCFPRCQLVQPRQLPATDLFCRLGRLLVVLVTPFCLLTAPHCSTSSLRSGSTIATTTGSFRCRGRCRPHVKSPRVSRNCCLLRPFAAARPTSVQHRPALAQLQQPSAIWGLAACSRFM